MTGWNSGEDNHGWLLEQSERSTARKRSSMACGITVHEHIDSVVCNVTWSCVYQNDRQNMGTVKVLLIICTVKVKDRKSKQFQTRIQAPALITVYPMPTGSVRQPESQSVFCRGAW